MSDVPGSSRILHRVARRWWLILAGMCVGALVSIAGLAIYGFYVSRQTPIYSSSSRLCVQYHGKIVDDRGRQSDAGRATDPQLITSRPLLDEVAALPEVRTMEIMKRVDNPTAFIKSGLTVAANGDFITITFESPNRIEAAQLVNAIAGAYISFTGKQHPNTAVEAMKSLQKEKDKREIELASRRKAVDDYTRCHGIICLRDEKPNMMLQRLSRLSELLATAQLETMDALAKLAVVTDLAKDPGKLLELARSESAKEMEANADRTDASHDQDDAHLLASSDAVRAEIDQTERRLDRLRRTRTPLHKDVKEAEADLAILKDQLARIESQILERKRKPLAPEQELAGSKKMQNASDAGLAQEVKDRRLVDGFVMRTTQRAARARQREAQLKKNLDEQNKAVFDFNATVAEYAAIESELSRTERLVNSLDERIKAIHVSEDTGVVTVNVIESARPAAAPVRHYKEQFRKRLPGVLSIGLVVGLILGIGLTLVAHFMARRT